MIENRSRLRQAPVFAFLGITGEYRMGGFMDGIFKNLQDPAWWFTAFVVGIIASVVAGFAKDYLEKKFGVFWSRSKARRDRARLTRQKNIEAWSENEGLVAILLLKGLTSIPPLVATGIGSGLLLYQGRIEYGEHQNLPVPFVILLAFMFAALMLVLWLNSTDISNARGCFREFRKRRGLPNLGGGW